MSGITEEMIREAFEAANNDPERNTVNTSTEVGPITTRRKVVEIQDPETEEKKRYQFETSQADTMMDGATGITVADRKEFKGIGDMGHPQFEDALYINGTHVDDDKRDLGEALRKVVTDAYGSGRLPGRVKALEALAEANKAKGGTAKMGEVNNSPDYVKERNNLVNDALKTLGIEQSKVQQR